MKKSTLKRLTGIVAIAIAITGMSLGSTVKAASEFKITGSMSGTYIHYMNPPKNFFGSSTVGVFSQSAHTKRAYYKLNTLPALNPDDVIIDAKVTFNSVGNATPRGITVNGCAGLWDLSTITFLNEVGYGEQLAFMPVPGGSLQAPAPFSVDITSEVQKWYSTGMNTGLMLSQSYLSSVETTLASKATFEMTFLVND